MKVPATKQLTAKQIQASKMSRLYSEANKEFLMAGPGKRKKLISQRRRAKMGFYLVKRAEQMKALMLRKRLDKKHKIVKKGYDESERAGKMVDPWWTVNPQGNIHETQDFGMHSRITNDEWYAKEMGI